MKRLLVCLLALTAGAYGASEGQRHQGGAVQEYGHCNVQRFESRGSTTYTLSFKDYELMCTKSRNGEVTCIRYTVVPGFEAQDPIPKAEAPRHYEFLEGEYTYQQSNK